MYKIFILTVFQLFVFSCTDSEIASRNLSKAADNFEILRRVVFYNGITGEYILSIEGMCAFFHMKTKRQVTVTCKTGRNQYKKHALGLADNVTYFSEQIRAELVSTYHYRVTFKPQAILPDIDFRGDAGQLLDMGEPGAGK